MEFQTRSEHNGIKTFDSLTAAFNESKVDSTVWKVSFSLITGERVRLVKTPEGWIYKDLMEEVREMEKSNRI